MERKIIGYFYDKYIRFKKEITQPRVLLARIYVSCERFPSFIYYKFGFDKMRADKKLRNRRLMVFLASLFFLDYLLFCYHAEKNPFDIFPLFPVKDERKTIDVYLPDLDGVNLIKEAKRIPVIKDRKDFIKLLFQKVIDGSEYENTSASVPVKSYIREIWIYDDICILDLSFSRLSANTPVLPGSEENFKRAISKTIMENDQSVKEVILLDRGISGRPIWELNEKNRI